MLSAWGRVIDLAYGVCVGGCFQRMGVHCMWMVVFRFVLRS